MDSGSNSSTNTAGTNFTRRTNGSSANVNMCTESYIQPFRANQAATWTSSNTTAKISSLMVFTPRIIHVGFIGTSDPINVTSNVPITISATINNINGVPNTGSNSDFRMIGIAEMAWPMIAKRLLPTNRCLPTTVGGGTISSSDASVWAAKPSSAYGALAARWTLDTGTIGQNQIEFAPTYGKTSLAGVNALQVSDTTYSKVIQLTGAFNVPSYLRGVIGHLLQVPTSERQIGRSVEFWFKSTSYNGILCSFSRLANFFNNFDYDIINLDSVGIHLSFAGFSNNYIAYGNFLDGNWHHLIFSRGPVYGIRLVMDGLTYLLKPWLNATVVSPVTAILVGPQETVNSTVNIHDLRVYSGEFADPLPLQLIPSQISGLIQWLKADAGLFTTSAGITPAINDGDPVGLWVDQSGNGNNASQSINGNRSTLGLRNIGGIFPTVRLNGSSSYFNIPGITIGAMFVVCNFTKASVFANFETLYMLAASVDLSQPPWHGSAAPGPYYLWRGYASPTAWRAYPHRTPPVVGAVEAIPIEYMYVNGQNTNSLGTDLSNFNLSSYWIQSPNTPIPFDQSGYLGADLGNPGREWEGDVAEIVVFNRILTLSEVLSMYYYLSRRYPILP
jgi:hypothetical protein